MLTDLEKEYIRGLLHKQLCWMLIGGDHTKLETATHLTISICKKLELDPLAKRVTQ